MLFEGLVRSSPLLFPIRPSSPDAALEQVVVPIRDTAAHATYLLARAGCRQEARTPDGSRR